VAIIETTKQAVEEVQILEVPHGIEGAHGVQQDVQEEEDEDQRIVCQTLVAKATSTLHELVSPDGLDSRFPAPTIKNQQRKTKNKKQEQPASQGTQRAIQSQNDRAPKAFARDQKQV